MANIELVIKIAEEAYQGIVNANKAHGQWGNDLLGILCAGIANGTQLPKGHGRLIDENKLLENLKESANHHANNSREESLLYRDRVIVSEQPAIIEADKTESEGQIWKQ